MNWSSLLPLIAATSVPLLALEGTITYMGYSSLDPLVAAQLVPQGSVMPRLPLLDVARLIGAVHIVGFHFHQGFSEVFGYGKYWLSFFFFAAGLTHSYTANRRAPLANAQHGLSKFLLGYVVSMVLFAMAGLGG